MNRLRFLLVLMLTAIVGCFLIGLKDVKEEIIERFAVYEHSFGSVKNVTLNWREKLFWFTLGETEDVIRFSWLADGIVRVYLLSETQFENLMRGNSTVYCEYFAEFYFGTMELALVNNDSYYVVVENQSPLPCKVKLYVAECKLLRICIARESRSIEIYPYEEIGAMIILLTVSIGLLSLPKR